MTDPITQTQADRARYNTLESKVRAPQPRKQSDCRWMLWFAWAACIAVGTHSAFPDLIGRIF
jgi:hypothetical protein